VLANIAYFFLLLRVRSQCVNKATIQPLMTVVVMWTRASTIWYAPPLCV